MSAFVLELARASFGTLCDLGGYLLGGLLLAGLLKVFLREERVVRWLGRDDWRSLVLAAIAGLPLPLCSCSVLPTALHLRRSGASKGATTAFLISTPETGVDSIGVTWALMGPVMALVRPLAALTTALATGALVNWLTRRERTVERPPEHAGHEHAGHEHAGHEHATREHAPSSRPRGVELVREVVRYGASLLDDMAGWMIVGVVLSSVLALTLPTSGLPALFADPRSAMPLMLVIGLPLYVCASAATPIAMVLIQHGMSPGAALVLLLAGPAMSAGSLGVLFKILGRRTTVAYVLGIAVCTLTAGALLQAFFEPALVREWRAEAALGPERGLVSKLGGLLLAAALLRSLVRQGLLAEFGRRILRATRALGLPVSRGVLRTAAIAVAGLFLADGSLTRVAPGEQGWVLRFGRVVRAIQGPALLLHWPLPIERVTRLATERVRRVTSADDAGESSGVKSSAFLSGDEKLVKVTFSTHYSVREPELMQFGLAEPRELVAAAAEAAVSSVVASKTADAIFATRRSELQQEILLALQEELDLVQSGFEARALDLIYVHVPDEVHEAYLSVASAEEERRRRIHQTESMRAKQVSRARAEALARSAEAEGAAATTLAEARGQAARFAGLRQAHELAPLLDEARREAQALEEALASAEALVLCLGAEVDLRVVPPGGPARTSGGSSGSTRSREQ